MDHPFCHLKIPNRKNIYPGHGGLLKPKPNLQPQLLIATSLSRSNIISSNIPHEQSYTQATLHFPQPELTTAIFTHSAEDGSPPLSCHNDLLPSYPIPSAFAICT